MEKDSHYGKRNRSMDRRKFLIIASSAVVAGASALIVPRAGAQSGVFPGRPISIVVTWSPGTAPDILARIIASDLPAHLGQNVIVENKPGAGGSIGTAAVARAMNDGYTLCLVTPAPMVINPWLYRNLPYDPIKDFAPLIKLANTPNLLLVSAQSPVTSVQDLMRRMKERKKGNYLQYASLGNGSNQHLEAVMLANLAGAGADHVPYRSSADELTALVSGQVDFTFAPFPFFHSYVKSGRLRALGITSARPSALLPEVPSLSSAGLDGFDKTDPWFGVVAPKGTPDAVMQTLHRAFAKALGNADIQAKLVAAGYDPAPPAAPDEFAQFIRDQFLFWRDLVKASGAAND
jgi:tripartite-type tricarboxylate transporter receptor subunit TctC